MEESSLLPGKVKAALFVDFDNIYSGLKSVHPKAAEEFAYNPARWLAWFEQGMPTRETEDGAQLQKRALLLRHCYLNPTVFGRYRAYFTRAAFKVVDCPPLTQQNKNSTDIHMVMDILDALRHDTRFDEFILLSGDSDFTPVLLRLRLYSRQSVVLTPGPAAQAYKAASDLVVSEDVFIEEGLGLRPERVRREPPAAQYADDGGGDVLDLMAQKVYERAAASGSLPAAALPGIYRQFPSFAASVNWLGFFSLIDLTRELVRRSPGMHVADCMVDGKKSWELRPGLTSAQQEFSPTPSAAPEEWEGYPEELSAFARRVSRVTGAPPLRPEEYAVVFKALEDELREEDYFLASTSRAVRDRCTLRGHPVSRKDISFILKGVTYGGHDFDENPLANTAGTFAQVFREQVHKLCKSAQLDLSGEEQALLQQWIRT